MTSAMSWFALSMACRLVGLSWAAQPETQPGTTYPDHRPTTALSLRGKDHSVVLRHGGGPDRCDELGARDAWVWESGGIFYMHYDAPGDDSIDHMRRNIGLAWLDLPLRPPSK